MFRHFRKVRPKGGEKQSFSRAVIITSKEGRKVSFCLDYFVEKKTEIFSTKMRSWLSGFICKIINTLLWMKLK